MKIELANRIRELPPYLFARIDALKNEERKKGKDLIDLGIGDPDLPTPPHIVAGAGRGGARSVDAPLPVVRRDGGLPQGRGRRSCRRASALTFDAQKEVICVIGSKEAIAHFPFAFVNPGDVVLCPDPGYPVYATLTRFAGGEPYFMPLRRDNGFLHRSGRDPGRRRAAREDHVDQLPEQPDRRAGGARLLRDASSRSRRSTTSSSPAISPTARCTTRRRRIRSWRRRARARSASSSTRCRRPTT